MENLKVKDIVVEEDLSENNLIRNNVGEVIGYNRSKCTVKFIFEDTNGKEYFWVKKNKEIAKAIQLIAENEEKKYKVFNKPIPEKEIVEFSSGKFLLGRYLFFLSWLYPLYDKVLIKYGLQIPEKFLIHAKNNKEREENEDKDK